MAICVFTIQRFPSCLTIKKNPFEEKLDPLYQDRNISRLVCFPLNNNAIKAKVCTQACLSIKVFQDSRASDILFCLYD